MKRIMGQHAEGKSETATKGGERMEGERCSPHSQARPAPPSRVSNWRSVPRLGAGRMDGWMLGGCWRLNKDRQDRWRERERERRWRRTKGLCLVISSHNPPSEAVVRWLAGRPGGPTACAGPPIRQRSGPGCHLGCSGRSSWRLPGKRPRRFPPWGTEGQM